MCAGPHDEAHRIIGVALKEETDRRDRMYPSASVRGQASGVRAQIAVHGVTVPCEPLIDDDLVALEEDDWPATKDCGERDTGLCPMDKVPASPCLSIRALIREERLQHLQHSK